MKQLMVHIERAVRPVRAEKSTKCNMREELYAHIVSVYEEELTRTGNDDEAVTRACRRFGDPSELTPQLQQSVWRLPIGGRYLCGHDEQHWFVASLPFDQQTTTVRGAMEALKPAVVLREQKRKGVKHRRYRRKTAAYVRQGEWFFLPRPKMHVGELAIRNGQLVRGAGKPHRVEPSRMNGQAGGASMNLAACCLMDSSRDTGCQ